MPFLERPKGFWYSQGPRLGPQGSKVKIFKTERNTLGIYPTYTCAKFQTDLTICAFPRAPQMFLVHLGSSTGSSEPKSQNFQKMKKIPPVIHPSYVCQNQKDLIICTFLRVPRRILVYFGSRIGCPGCKLKISKNEKTPGIYPSYKCAKFQTFAPSLEHPKD